MEQVGGNHVCGLLGLPGGCDETKPFEFGAASRSACHTAHFHLSTLTLINKRSCPQNRSARDFSASAERRAERASCPPFLGTENICAVCVRSNGQKKQMAAGCSKTKRNSMQCTTLFIKGLERCHLRNAAFATPICIAIFIRASGGSETLSREEERRASCLSFCAWCQHFPSP